MSTACRPLAPLALLALFAISLPAQEVTGALQGRATLSDGTPAVGVQLVVSGRHLQGSRQRVTDNNGFYQFLALPPGAYTLRLTRIGVRPVSIERIGVDLGRTTGLAPIVLEPIVQTG